MIRETPALQHARLHADVWHSLKPTKVALWKLCKKNLACAALGPWRKSINVPFSCTPCTLCSE